MGNFYLFVSVLLAMLSVAHAMYENGKSNVVSVSEKTFNNEVMKSKGIVIVEFYAPWCGHCKSLEPEYEKAAGVLKDVVKVVAVDATTEQGLASKYGIQGFPTIKVFGSDKKNPVDYQGQRTADAIVTESMKAVNQLVKDRKKGKTSSSSNESKPKSNSNSGSKGSKSDVIELTDLNFNALVTESNDVWLVEFFAPWCGHCKALAPEWEVAASQLKGSVKLGAVDATVHTALAQQYGVKGYPTIKVFIPGKKNKADDYKGPRESAGIVQYALNILDTAGVPPPMPQLVSKSVYQDSCEVNGRICVFMFVPHILDTGADGRNKYLATFADITKEFRGKPFNFVWAEGGAHEELESVLDVNSVYPTISVLSNDKGVYSTLKLSWNLKNIKSFLNGVLAGSEKITKLAKKDYKISKVVAWDGKDGVLEEL
jgi:protein disulfide-isomerase A6